MYNKIVDPEGVLSTIPSVCHVLIGFCCGKMLMEAKDNQLRIQKLFIVGTILTFSGFLFSYACPIIKGIWSPSFVLVTCGLASLLLALLVWIIDMKGYKRWGVFFESFGVNPLFIYVFAEVFSGVLGYIRFPYGEGYISAKGFIYDVVLQPIFGNSFGSLIYSLIFIFFIWIVGNILYRKRIYIKI